MSAVGSGHVGLASTDGDCQSNLWRRSVTWHGFARSRDDARLSRCDSGRNRERTESFIGDANSEACLGPLVDLESELSAPADWSIETKAFTLNAWAENAAIGDMERVFGIDAWRRNQTWQGAVARFIELDENTPTPIFGRPCHVVLKEPADHFPTDLGEQLEWVMEHWDAYLSEETRALYLLTKDVEAEFYAARFGGGGPAQFSRLDTDIGALDGMNLVSQDAGEDTVGYVDARPRFSDDADWMPRLVMMAKQSYVAASTQPTVRPANRAPRPDSRGRIGVLGKTRF